MRVGINVHGVITTDPGLWATYLRRMVLDGYRVYIISGPPMVPLMEELTALGLEKGKHFSQVLSVVDFIKHSGIEMEERTPGHWWTDEETWNSAKGKLCEIHEISLVVDDMAAYEKWMPELTTFVLHTRGGMPSVIVDLLQEPRHFDEPIKTVQFAEKDQVEALEPWVNKVLEALGMDPKDVMLTNESLMGHFVQDEFHEDEVSERLGIPWDKHDTIVEVAQRLMEETLPSS